MQMRLGCWLARVLTWDDRLPLWRNIQTLLNKYLSWGKISSAALREFDGGRFLKLFPVVETMETFGRRGWGRMSCRNGRGRKSHTKPAIAAFIFPLFGGSGHSPLIYDRFEHGKLSMPRFDC